MLFFSGELGEELDTKPDFTLLLSNAMARAGQKIKLECEALGNPTPTFIWLHNDQPVDNTDHIKVSNTYLYIYDNNQYLFYIHTRVFLSDTNGCWSK